MATNVFGNPITDATLQAMPEYIGKVITATDRAHVALNMKNAENKDVNARTFVENLKTRYGNGVSTLCLIYNATGGPLKFVGNHDWNGHIGESPYPNQLANGQCMGCLSSRRDLWSSYWIDCSLCVSWRKFQWNWTRLDAGMVQSMNRAGDDNRVYTDQIREAKHYETDHWKYIRNLLKTKGLSYTETWGGCVSTVSTGSSTSPIFEGVMTLVGA